jgi:hypothetical protein
MIRHLVTVCLALLAAAPAARAQSATPSADETRTLNLTAYAELLRGDIRLQKVAIITEVMGFDEAEDKAFWPVYRDYDAEMSKLSEERVALIADYAAHFDDLTDAAADALARRALDLERRRQAAKGQLYARVKAALNGRTALRVLQVEHQLQQLIDLQISAALPVAAR